MSAAYTYSATSACVLLSADGFVRMSSLPFVTPLWARRGTASPILLPCGQLFRGIPGVSPVGGLVRTFRHSSHNHGVFGLPDSWSFQVPKSYIVLSFLWKGEAYPIGTGWKIAYLFLAQSTKKHANQELLVPNRYDQLSGSQSKLIILVDEIDRCLPDVQSTALSLGPGIQKGHQSSSKRKTSKFFEQNQITFLFSIECFLMWIPIFFCNL